MRHLFTFTEFVRKQYQLIILAAVIAGLLSGWWTTAPGKALQTYSQALTFMMILFISLTVTPRQFALVVRQPGQVLAGLFLNFVYMPLVCWILASLLIDDANLAVGIILVGVVPCAGMAAVWTALLKGDVPLSMAINALTMLLAPFLIPPLMALMAGSGMTIHAWEMFQQLAIILLIPLTLGIGIRWLAERKWNVKPYLPLFPALSALTAVLLMFTVCNVNVPLLTSRPDLLPSLFAATVLISPLGFFVPHILGGRFLGWGQRIAVTYASGMKNLPIAVGLAFASFDKLTGLPIAMAFILQMLTASLFYRYLQSRPGRALTTSQIGDSS
jgi:arsenite transporter